MSIYYLDVPCAKHQVLHCSVDCNFNDYKSSATASHNPHPSIRVVRSLIWPWKVLEMLN